MMIKTKNTLAVTGETIAAQYVAKIGMNIVVKNYHSAYGEIDIIAKDKDELVYVEVKTRTNHSLKAAENSISLSKQKKLTLTAMHFNLNHPQYSELSNRFDVIIIFYFKNDDTYKVKHYKNAFNPVFPQDNF